MNVLSEKDLLSLYKLKHLTRYNSRPKIQVESVAEHSFFVSVIALQICRQLKTTDDVTNKVLIKCILHDLPEMDLNDITHDVKVRLNLYPFLKKYEDEYYESNFKEDAKLMTDDSDNLVNSVLLLADILSVMQYCYEEKRLGNTSDEINEIIKNTQKRVTDTAKHIKSLTGVELK